MTNPFLQTDRRIIGDVYTDTTAMDNLTILCDDFGSRFGGTAGEAQTVEFLQQKLAEYGLANIELEPVPYNSWQRGTATLQIISPIERTIPCISLPHTPPTTVKGKLLDLGGGSPARFVQHHDDIAGNIVMANSVVTPDGEQRWIHRGEKLGRTILAGGSAFIFVNHYPGYGPATGGAGHLGYPALIPAIAVAYEEGAYLQRLLKRYGEISLRITTTDVITPTTTYNILADLPGVTHPDEVVMLGSHYDGHDISQGATDPASGTVAVLDAARVLSAYFPAPARTIRFAFWAVEEIGLLGSKVHVANRIDQLDAIRFYLNMDSAGEPGNNRDLMLNEWPELTPIFSRWRSEMARDFLIGQSVKAFSDHYPFFMAGVPTGGMESVKRSMAGRGYGHTAYDTLDKVEAKGVREATAFGARLALRMAQAEDWPVARRDQAAIEAILDGPGYQAETRYHNAIDAHYLKAYADDQS